MNEVQAINTHLNLLNQSLINRLETLQSERDAALQEVDDVTERLSNTIEDLSVENDRLKSRARSLKEALHRCRDMEAETRSKLEAATTQIATLSAALEEVTESVEQVQDEEEKPELDENDVRFMLAMLEGNAALALASLLRSADKKD